MSNKQSIKISDMIEGFRTAMLVTVSENEQLTARPMAIAEHDEHSNALVFSTSADTGKIDDLQRNPEVSITMQSGAEYVSLSGRATISNDRDRIAKLFNKTWEIWYPEGPTQADIRLIDFDPSFGEYWDMSGTDGLKFLWSAAKSLMSDDAMDDKVSDSISGSTAL